MALNKVLRMVREESIDPIMMGLLFVANILLLLLLIKISIP